MKRYIALIEEGEDNYSVLFPDVPGVITVGDTYEETIRNAHEALAFHLEDAEGLPSSRTLPQIKETWEGWPEWQRDGNFTVAYIDLLPAQPKRRRINITIDENLLAYIDKRTHNRSEFIAKAVESVLAAG
jgi:predicted RNase H-like HicB family nuclease